jgi:hypothetical protein
MCIAILKPDGEKIKKDRLSTCFTNNDDGAGYMFAKDGTLHFFKGFFKFNEFWKSYVKNVVKNGNPMAAIHFRIKTHGKTNVDNCHPFKINGKLPENFIRNSAITSLIEESIGTSKLVFLDSKGQYLISNESLGKWDNNVWYSNTTYKWCFTYYNQPVYGYSLGSDSYKKSKKNQKKDISGYLVPKAIRTTCRMCEALLYTRFEQNQGYCGGCDTTGYAG